MGNIAEETAVLEPVDSAEGTEQDAAEEEPEKKRRRVLPFLRAHKVAAGGIAAALVVGAIGVGVVSLQAADAGTGGVTAEQKADPKTPAAKTGETRTLPGPRRPRTPLRERRQPTPQHQRQGATRKAPPAAT